MTLFSQLEESKMLKFNKSTPESSLPAIIRVLTGNDYGLYGAGTLSLGAYVVSGAEIFSEVLRLKSNAAGATAAANYFLMENSIAAGKLKLSAMGTDPNISVDIIAKGTGKLQSAGVDVVLVGGTQTLASKTLDAPTITGIGTAPTAATGTNTLQLATTAYVMASKNIANETVAGIVMLATVAECMAGTNTADAVTPAGLKAVADTKLGVNANAVSATTAGTCTGNAASATTAGTCTGNAASATTAGKCTGNAATATTAGACSGRAEVANTADKIGACPAEWVLNKNNYGSKKMVPNGYLVTAEDHGMILCANTAGAKTIYVASNLESAQYGFEFVYIENETTGSYTSFGIQGGGGWPVFRSVDAKLITKRALSAVHVKFNGNTIILTGDMQ